MTLTQLKYVVAIDTHRHFAKAAEHSFVTQPTLSMQVNKLEQELGLKIFNRKKQPIEPTRVGEAIIKQARLVLSESGRIEEIVKAAKGEVGGEFRLGIIPTVSTSLLPRFLREVLDKYPQITLRIKELQTAQILNMLTNDRLDAAILATPLGETGFTERPLYYEPFMAYIPEGHRLETEEFVLLSELKVKDILLLKEGHCFRENVLNICDSAFPEGPNNHRDLEFESGNFETLIRLADRGFGMTLLPYLTALDLSEEAKARIKPIEHPQPTREISIVFRDSQPKMKVIEILSEEIKKHLPERVLEPEHGRPVSPLAVDKP